MKKVLLGVGAVLGLTVVGVLGAAAMQPEVMHIERSATFAAAPQDIGPYASDLKLWAEWNPWKDLDPAMAITYHTTTAGPGAWYSWTGNEKVGNGKMTVLTVADDKITHDLEFFEPWQSKSTISFTFAPEGESTKVTWAMDETLPFTGKVMSLFMDMDAMLGADFEKGLTKLKPLAEGAASTRKDGEAASQAAADAAAAALPVEGAPLDGAPVEAAPATTP